MDLQITARHIELTPAISEYVHKKLEKIERHTADVMWAQVILSIEKLTHSAEIIVHSPGSTFRTQADSRDLYSAIDILIDKLDTHLTREKSRKNNRRELKKAKAKMKDIAFGFANLDGAKSKITSFVKTFSNGEASPVQESVRILLELQTLENALEKIQAESYPAFPFIDSQTHRIQVLYRKGKKKFGLIEVEE